MKKKKKGLGTVGIISLVIGMIAVIWSLMYIAAHYQPAPDELFKQKVKGRWANLTNTEKTWIQFEDDNKCYLSIDGKVTPCAYKVKNFQIFVMIETTTDLSQVLQKISLGNKSGFDMREATSLGLEIFQIHIENNLMKAKMKAVSGIRSTVARNIILKKLNPKPVKIKKR